MIDTQHCYGYDITKIDTQHCYATDWGTTIALIIEHLGTSSLFCSIKADIKGKSPHNKLVGK